MTLNKTLDTKRISSMLGLSLEDGEFFEKTINFLTDNYNTEFTALKEEYLKKEGRFNELSIELANASGICKYTLDYCILLSLCPDLYSQYMSRCYDESLFINTMSDLKYKLAECKSVYGIRGTFVTDWFKRFFLLERFALGRLQFERTTFNRATYGKLKEGSTVYQCHIPSSGKLLYDEVIASLKKAWLFYKDELLNGLLPVVCNSWILYPPHSNAFRNGTNLNKFSSLFNVIDVVTYDNYPDLWRVFTIPYPTEIELLPEKTSLQKDLKRLYLSGIKAGNGYGVILFDGEKIIL